MRYLKSVFVRASDYKYAGQSSANEYMATHKDPVNFQTAFNSYSVRKLIGEGGSGRVYETTDSNGAVVAIKTLDPSHLTGDKVRRFKNETHFCLRSPHKNIITVLEYGSRSVGGKQCPFYVMPLYPETLRTLICRGIEVNKVLHYFAQLLDGIEAAHLFGVWHRDLKPENILFEPASNSLVIADFGIARFVKESLYTLVETRPNARLANFQYAAPEQRTRGKDVDHRADIYSLGLILNEMFTHQVIQGTAFKTIGSVEPNLSYLDELVDNMIRQTTGERPDSINRIKELLLARRNEFVSRQRLNKLKSEVISQTDIDDPLVLDPLRIVGVDYDTGDLVFTFNKEPTVEWEYSFRNISGYPILLGSDLSPQSVRFHGKAALVALMSQGQAQPITDIFKTYVELANRNYAEGVKKQGQEKEEALRTKLRRQIEEEERRREILGSVRL
jgi:serine/threonine protein kinase